MLELFRPDYYAVLRVDRAATEQQITDAYRQLATHPRRWDALFGQGPARAREAYEVLSDPQRRQHYDATLERLLVNLPVPPM